jgi:very-short-patch-repair endonuclease
MHPMKNEGIKQKVADTFYKNGTTKTSSQQIQVFNMIEALGYSPILNYPILSFNLDVALFYKDKLIDVEYDGWHWHKDTQADIRRNHVLIDKGLYIIRILSDKLIPDINQINDALNNVINNNKKLQLITLSDWGGA